jgi:hypothetical protein
MLARRFFIAPIFFKLYLPARCNWQIRQSLGAARIATGVAAGFFYALIKSFCRF